MKKKDYSLIIEFANQVDWKNNNKDFKKIEQEIFCASIGLDVIKEVDRQYRDLYLKISNFMESKGLMRNCGDDSRSDMIAEIISRGEESIRIFKLNDRDLAKYVENIENTYVESFAYITPSEYKMDNMVSSISELNDFNVFKNKIKENILIVMESDVFSNSFKDSLKYFGEKIENLNIEDIKDLKVSNFIKDKDIENPAKVLNNLFDLSDQYLKIVDIKDSDNLKNSFKYLIESAKNYVSLELIADELSKSGILNVNKLREIYNQTVKQDIKVELIEKDQFIKRKKMKKTNM